MADKVPEETAVNNLAELSSTMEVNPKSEWQRKVLPQATMLKERFKAGSIPLQTDFADLIDLANVGRQAIGGTEGQTGPANGFILSSTGRLELKPNTTKGVMVDQDGVAIKVGPGMRINNAGMIEPAIPSYPFGTNDVGTEYCPIKVNTSTNGLVVDLNQGLINTLSGLSVKAGSGVQVDSNGVGVKAGNGVALNGSGVNLKLAKGSHTNGGEGQGSDGVTTGNAGGLALSSNGLSIDAGDGIQINTRGVSIKLAANSGLSADENNGLKIVPEQQFQRGMIIMFSGTSAPSGWALCNGSNGTPDLRNKFIRASNGFASSTGGSNTTSFTPKGTVSINNHALTINEIPPHRHGIRLYYNSESPGTGPGSRYPLLGTTNLPLQNQGDGTTENILHFTGDGAGHRHGASFSGETGSMKVEPEYFALAFIMKL